MDVHFKCLNLSPASKPDIDTRTTASSLTIKEVIMYKKRRARIEKLDLTNHDVWLNFIDTGRIENFTLDEEFLKMCTKISDGFQSKPTLCLKIKLAGIKVDDFSADETLRKVLSVGDIVVCEVLEEIMNFPEKFEAISAHSCLLWKSESLKKISLIQDLLIVAGVAEIENVDLVKIAFRVECQRLKRGLTSLQIFRFEDDPNDTEWLSSSSFNETSQIVLSKAVPSGVE